MCDTTREQRRSLVFPVTAVCAMAACAMFANDAGAVGQATLHERANQALGLHGSTLVTLEVDRTPGVTQTVSVPFGDGALEFTLVPHSNRAAQFRVRHQVADGSLFEVPTPPMQTVRGTLLNAGGTVVGAVTEAGLTAAIRLADGSEVWVESLSDRIEGAARADHVVYTGADVVLSGGSCAAGVFDARLYMDEAPMPELGAGCLGLPCMAELACDADREFFNIWGGATATRIEQVINFVNQQYEAEVGIVFEITEIIIRTEEPDPYDLFVCGDLLDQFRDYWQNNHPDVVRDVAHLFTGKNIQGCAGIAYGGGQICGPLAYSLVPNFGPLLNAASVSAHELGHNWSAQHCGVVGPCDPSSFPPGGCSCGCHTMRCSTVFCREFHETCTVPFISAHRDNRLCLDALAPPVTFPFEDSFDGPDVDPTLWYNGGAVVDGQGNGEPSGSTSLRITGSTRATSGYADATSVDYVGVEYWWQRTGDSGGSPEVTEDLIVEYVGADRVWRELNRQPGEGSDTEPYARSCAIIPDADLSSVQIRLSMDRGQPQSDNFFVDDVRIVDGAEFLGFEVSPQVDCACSVNGSAQFTALAAGEPPFQYQWRFNGQDLSGETNPTLDLPDVGPADFGNYSVEISNGCGSITSDEAALIEVGQPAVTQHPMDSEVLPGFTLSLFTFASGGCTQFQWFRNGEPIPGATSSFLFIPNMQCENQGCYHSEVSNDCGAAVSNVAVVTVTGCPPVDCVTDPPPEVVHAAGLAGETRPFSGYIDPRIESSDGVSFDRGLTQLALRFSEPVQNVGGGGLTLDAFVVTETGGVAPPNVVSVNTDDMPLVVVTLDRPITLREYTTVRAAVQDFADTPNLIVDNGNQGPGTDETDRVDVAFLPGDVDQTGSVTPFDLLVFRQIVNDVTNPTQGMEADFVDTDRDNVIAPFDLLAFRQLVNGVPPATQSWSGETLNNARP